MKSIRGYEGLYSVTRDGKVYSHRNKRYLSSCRTYGKNTGLDYQCVQLCSNGTGKRKSLHRLVAEAFMPNPKGLENVDHIDRDPKNNNVSNLRWCTFRQNQMNRNKRKDTSSKFIGVCWDKYYKKWVVGISVGKGQAKRTGRYDNEIEAAMAYNELARFHYGEFANLNIV